MAELKLSTVMTLQEAVKAKQKAVSEGRFQEAMLLGDYADQLAQAEIYQKQEQMILLNPRSLSKADSYIKVQQLVEDLSYQAVPQNLRDKILKLEQQLKQG